MENSELLVELGVEEIPAWMLAGAAGQFAEALRQGLQAHRLGCIPGKVYFTPRRIVVGLRGIPVRQEALDETVTGPPKAVAFDAEGRPTRAALAFAQKNGVAVEKLRVVKTPKGEYVSVVRRVKGERTREILNRIVPQAIAAIQFPKTMHWTPDNFKFARPLRWIVALYQGRPLKFTVASVAAGRNTCGHRFLGAHSIRVESIEDLASKLAANGVVVDPAERRARIQDGLAREAAAAGGRLIPDDDLLGVVVNLNECPCVIRGGFEERFLELPKEILVTVMREHQKYFSVVDDAGNLLPVFLAVINLDVTDTAKIRAGHERVLRARLADASFFWEIDRKTPLPARREALRSVLFQEKLGSYHDKTERILRLLPKLVAATAGDSVELGVLEQAASLMKCDLVTEMVKEFTDLQGVVGGLYARSEGYPEAVWKAVYEQYLPKSTTSASPSSRLSALLSLADKLDTVCGCFSAGLIPSGSKDPFAVRRAGNGILKILLDHDLQLSLEEVTREGAEPFGSGAEVLTEVRKFFEGRLRFLFEERGYAYDCINAALAAGWDNVVDARDRVKALETMHREDDFLSVASNFKRIVNILALGGSISVEPDPARMTDPEERQLLEAYHAVRPLIDDARGRRAYDEALHHLASMRQAVDTFFDKVLVMAPDQAVRSNRLALLSALSRLFLSVADISQIVLDKSARG
jgi:glycyl-tRNA synthetase beta chain